MNRKTSLFRKNMWFRNFLTKCGESFALFE